MALLAMSLREYKTRATFFFASTIDIVFFALPRFRTSAALLGFEGAPSERKLTRAPALYFAFVACSFAV